MKITGYRLLETVQRWGRPVGDVNGYVESGITAQPMVVLETDEGVEGVGFGMHSSIKQLFPALEGQDPRGVSALYDRMLAQVFKAGHAGAVFGAIGALDTALWDIKAKLAGEPLWRLLGGRDRFVPGYASGLDVALSDQQLETFYREMAGRGFTSAKLKGGRDFEHDASRLELVRDVLSSATDTPVLMFDANESWNLNQAIRYVTKLEERVDLAWIEEPLRRWDGQGMNRLRSRIRAGVASGENLTGLEQYRYLWDTEGVDVVQTAAVWGVTHFLRVAGASHSRDIPISSVGIASNYSVVHATTAVPNHLITEVPTLLAADGVTIHHEVADGGIVLSDEPGGGISIDEATILDVSVSQPWGGAAGPHVRDVRAGLSLGLRD